MAKKKKPPKPPEKKNNKNLIIIAVVVVIAVIAVAGLQMRQTSDKASVPAVDDQSLRKGETRRTLSPSQFSDPYIAAMYQVARDIPHVLDSVKCYCFCERSPFNHKSLLSCYVATHAAGWGICLNEARRASELYKDGRSIKEISDTIDREFGS